MGVQACCNLITRESQEKDLDYAQLHEAYMIYKVRSEVLHQKPLLPKPPNLP